MDSVNDHDNIITKKLSFQANGNPESKYTDVQINFIKGKNNI